MLDDRNWKYDYKKYPLGYVVPGLKDKMVEVVKGEKTHDFKNFDEARKWAKSNIARVYTDEETGGKGDILISNATIQKYLTKSAVEKSESIDVHLSVLKVLPKIISKSIIVEIHPDFKKKNGFRDVCNGINANVIILRLYGALGKGNNLYRVKVTIKVNIREKEFPKIPHSYEATKIELLNSTKQQSNSSIFNFETDTLAGTLGHDVMYKATPGTNFSIPAAKLLKNVELSYQKGKFLLD